MHSYTKLAYIGCFIKMITWSIHYCEDLAIVQNSYTVLYRFVKFSTENI